MSSRRPGGLRGAAAGSVLLGVEPTDQALDVLQFAGGCLFVCSQFGGEGDGPGGEGGRAAGEVRGGVQGYGTGASGQPPCFALAGAGGQAGQGGGEEAAAVGQRDGQRVGAVAEPRPDGVEEGVPVHRAGGGAGGGGRRRHVGVGVGEEASEGRHGQTLRDARREKGKGYWPVHPSPGGMLHGASAHTHTNTRWWES